MISLKVGNSTIPFEYQVMFPHYDQISRLSGVFVPPNRFIKNGKAYGTTASMGLSLCRLQTVYGCMGNSCETCRPHSSILNSSLLSDRRSKFFDISIALGARPVKGGCHKSF